MSRIFLSHSSADDFEAIAMRDWLASEGWKDVFLDVDPDRGIAAGERWERRLHEAANRCEAVVFLISANWLASGWCMKEYTTARRLNKKLFAVLVDPSKTLADLPPELTGTWQITNLAGGQDMRLFRAVRPTSHEEQHVGFSRDGLTRLKRGLQNAGLDARFFAWPPVEDPERAPYRGLKPLEAADAGIFFGRDASIVEAVDRLRGLAIGACPRLFVLLGASGAGKSSFLRAGLLPRLARDDMHFVSLPPIRPGRAAITGENGLVSALGEVCPSRTRATLRTAVKKGALEIRPILAELAGALVETRNDKASKPPAIVLAIDQAEELFRPEGAEEGQALLDIVRDLTTSDGPAVIVVFAIRSDTYDELERAKPLESLRQDALPLLPMPRRDYKDVVERPALRVTEAGGKLAIEPQLTRQLLEDIDKGGGSDALPLLAFTLEQLYLEYHQSGSLRLADYHAVGGLGGAIDAAIERAFVRADADRRIPLERQAREKLLRRGLIPWLAGIDPDTKSARRNIAKIADIPAEALPLIELLVEERLLSVDMMVETDAVSGERSTTTTIEPAHEALLRQWGLLEGWLAEDIGQLATLEGVKRASRDWSANAREDAWLAHQATRLTEALSLDDRPDIAARLGTADRAYLAGCTAREKAVRDAEANRRKEREDEQVRQLRDAQALVRRTGMGLAAAVVLAAVAVWQWREATKQGHRAAQTIASATQAADAMVTDLAKQMRDKAGMPIDLVSDILTKAHDLQKQLIASVDPAPANLLASEANGLNETVQTELAVGDSDAALRSAKDFIRIADDLVKRDPSNLAWQQKRSLGLDRLGDAHFATGDFKKAVEDFVESVSIRTNLLAKAPENNTAKRDLSAALLKLGDARHAVGGDEEDRQASEAYERSLALRKELVQSEPSNVDFKRDLSLSFERQGLLLAKFGDDSAALDALKESLSLRSTLSADNPDNTRSKRDLANAHDHLGTAYRQIDQLDSALDQFQKSLHIRKALADGEPKNLEWQRDLANGYAHLGDVLLTKDEHMAAITQFRSALDIKERMAAAAPDNDVWKGEVALNLIRLAEAGDDPKANLGKALIITENLNKKRLPKSMLRLEALIKQKLTER